MERLGLWRHGAGVSRAEKRAALMLAVTLGYNDEIKPVVTPQ
jgi:hypothetical protein